MLALLNPGMRGLIVRKTLASLGSTALVTWNRFVIPEAKQVGDVEWYGGSQQEAPGYRYRNGSTINVGGMDKATKIMSSEYDVAYVQEAIELAEADWEAITTRLRNGMISFQQIMGDTNPDVPTHWLKGRCDRGTCRMLDSRHEDNPILYTDDGQLTDVGAAYIAKLDALTGPRHARLRRGLWVAAEGQIYDGYDPARHLVDRFDIPPEWPRYWAVDFGFTNPQVIQWWAQDPDGRLYLYREIYHTRRTVDVHARHALAQVVDERGRWTEPRPRAIICDHDAEGRAVLERELGMGTVAARKTVTDGIQAAQARIRPAGDGKPRLYLLRDSLVERDQDLVDGKKPTCTAEEIPGYVWDTGAGKAPKEQPLKADDHGCDAMRYMVAEMDLQARPRLRMMR
jgi:phage terminase large subunit